MTTKQELIDKIKRFRVVGEEIGKLTEESKDLRKEIADAITELDLGELSETTPVLLAIGDMQAAVTRAKNSKDFTILTRDMNRLE
tara:strand:- start:178 stop:432 length:255 start_codon:yes stop_codon:yes gene_type:complete